MNLAFYFENDLKFTCGRGQGNSCSLWIIGMWWRKFSVIRKKVITPDVDGCALLHTHTLCLIGRCYSCVTRCSLVYFYAFTYCFSWTELCISKLKMCFMLKLFPRIRINLHLQNKRYNKKQSVLLRHVCFFFIL